MIPRLWYISDGVRGTAGRPLLEVIEAAAGAGLRAVIVRETGLPTGELAALIEALLPLRSSGLRVLVSRRLDLARAYDLDGVHLARDAVPVDEARAWLPASAWIGYSAHSGEEARQAARQGASYVTLSPIYPTESKPGAPARGLSWLSEAIRDLPIPALALGGVTPERTEGILSAGVQGVAAVSAIGAAPSVSDAVLSFRKAIGEHT